MNLYTSTQKKINVNLRPEKKKPNSQMVYLALLSKDNPALPARYNLITTISGKKKDLYVLKHGNLCYLADEYAAKDGIASIVFSSPSIKRTIGYAKQIVE